MKRLATSEELTAKLWVSAFLLLFSNVLTAQKTITGKITDSNNQPVAGSTIAVKGTNIATQADTSGNFSVIVPNGRNVITISSVGYTAREVKIANQNTVLISLQIEVSSLNDVVVTGYIAQRKKEITGSVSVVNVNDMKQMPVGTGEEALQGRASGVTVISSGQPGGASDIRIRGITAFGNNAPLVIVDGVRGDLHDIAVNDIESMQVLKDASAAIYGVSGSNGVIIITTKKSKTGIAKVNYDFYYGVTTSGTGYTMASTEEEANAIWLQQRNSGITNPSHKQYGNGPNPVIPDYITPFGSIEGDPGTDPSTYDINTNQITRANKVGTNWYDEVTRNAPKQNHHLSVGSGSEKSSYYFSLDYLNEQGIAKFQFLKRYSVRANTQFNIKDNIRVGENMYIFYKQNPRFGQGFVTPFRTAFIEDVIIPVYDIVGNYAGTKSQDLGYSSNPYADIARTKDSRSNTWDITGNVYAEVDFLKHCTIRTNFGGIIHNNYGFNFQFVPYEHVIVNTGTNSFNEHASYNSQWTFNNTITYNNTFGDHSVKVLLGTEAVSYSGRNVEVTRSNYVSENPDYWVVDAGSGDQSNFGSAYQSSLWSQFARLEYGYKYKYLINGSIRRDGSSVFAEDVRNGYFPAFSAGWIISQENFFKSVAFINNLKLRFSWGKLGSASNVQPTNPYNLYGSRTGRSFYDLNGNSTNPAAGFFSSYVGNPATTWEEDIISNIGLDATLFNNKLDFTIDVYKKKISGLLFPQGGVAADVIFRGDADVPKANLGDMQNTGIDIDITYRTSVGADGKLDITGMFTTYNNEIIDLPGINYRDGEMAGFSMAQRYMEGHPFGAFFGYRVLGLFQSDEEVLKSPGQDDAQPGVFKYQDVNEDGEINEADRTFIGDPNPDFTYGLNISASFKNFDFSAFFFGSHGNDILNSTLYLTDFPDLSKGAIRREVALNSWTPTNTNTDIPKLRTTPGFSTNSSGYTNSYFISDGSYFRSKQMQIGFNVPNRLLVKFGVDRLRIYVQGTNLFTITKYDGLDPELASQPDANGNIVRTYQYGIDHGNYPHTPGYLFGINLGF